jgi:hypothetical protein
MGAYHNILVSATSTTTAIEVEIPAPSGAKVRLRKIKAGQSNREGDAAAEMLAYFVTTEVTTSAGSTTVSSRPIANRESAITCKINTTQLSSGGTLQETGTFHNQAGWLEEWPDVNLAPDTAISGIMAIKIEAPASSHTWYWTITVEVES